MALLKWAGWAGAALAGWAAAVPIRGLISDDEALAIRAFTIYPSLSEATCCGWIINWEHFGWHDRSNRGWSGLDISKIGSGATGGVHVFLNGDGTPLRVDLVNWSGNCTGLKASFFRPDTGAYLGGEAYVHINPKAGVAGMSFVSGDVYMEMGHVSASQPSACPWTGAHVHQEGHVDQSTMVKNNSIPVEDGPAYTISIFTWMHEVQW